MKIFHRKSDKPAWMILLGLTGMLLGFLVITQGRYFTSYVESIGRDSNENIFRKIQVLKTGNDELEEEIKDLKIQLQDLSDQTMAIQSIENEIEKNKIIAGNVEIFGPGLEIQIETEISGIWFIDLINEFFAAGAQAISINNIRLVDSVVGFDTLPNGQVMINNIILKPPYKFEVIGDKSTLRVAIESQHGIIDKMKTTFEDFSYTLEEKDRIDMGIK
jgi:uncharacterized protein YlxW (UPF0749 family)